MTMPVFIPLDSLTELAIPLLIEQAVAPKKDK
jgi:hypothetical protein